jgi:hypothetical protein
MLEELPGLEPKDVAACLRFASQRLDHPDIAAIYGIEEADGAVGPAAAVECSPPAPIRR